jgi:hypothetical protein
MKKLIIAGLALAFIAGCGHSAKESGFYEHRAMWKNWNHAQFSMTGYKNPTADDAKLSAEQEWWGIDVPYVPAK